MAIPALEQMLIPTVDFSRFNEYKTIDIYASNIEVLYSGPMSDRNGGYSFHINPDQFNNNIRQTTLPDYGIGNANPYSPENEDLGITIEPFKNGMELEGGYQLYGDRNNAIINIPDVGMDIHHHNNGGGALYNGNSQDFILPWERQSKLNEYYK